MLAKLLAAIMAVESGGNCKAIGDQGRSIGPYQIQRAYWVDSKVGGVYFQCYDKKYSEHVIIAYWRRYAPSVLNRVKNNIGSKNSLLKDCERLARIHNGGPNGGWRGTTTKYWLHVKKHMSKGK